MRRENLAQRRLAADDVVLVLRDRCGVEVAMRVRVIAEVLAGVEPGVEDRFEIALFSGVHETQRRHMIAFQNRQQPLVPSQRIAAFCPRQPLSGKIIEGQRDGQRDGGQHPLTIIRAACECSSPARRAMSDRLSRPHFAIAVMRSPRWCGLNRRPAISAKREQSSSPGSSNRFPTSPIRSKVTTRLCTRRSLARATSSPKTRSRSTFFRTQGFLFSPPGYGCSAREARASLRS